MFRKNKTKEEGHLVLVAKSEQNEIYVIKENTRYYAHINE